ncbi:MAG TPA: cupin domain-containing protein [Actinomycetota bacterium]
MPVRVIRSDEQQWDEVPRPEGDTAPPGEEFVAFRSDDAAFSTGMWRRAPEEGPMEPPYHEIAFIVEGEVEVTDEEGFVHRAGPGDILVTPNGTKAVWRALSPVKKFWAVYKGD